MVNPENEILRRGLLPMQNYKENEISPLPSVGRDDNVGAVKSSQRIDVISSGAAGAVEKSRFLPFF